MEYRKLGSSAIELSAIAYGAFAIGGHMWGGNETSDSINAVRASIDAGVTTIDTAPFYGFGLSEEMVGQAIKGLDRAKIQLLTKFGLVWDGSNKGRGEYFFEAATNGKKISVYKYAAKNSIIKEVDQSLKRLGTDYIDLLQLHWPDGTTAINETMETLNLLIASGKIRAAGVSNYSLDQLKEALVTTPVVANQVPYSMLNRTAEKDIIPFALAHNIGIIAYSPLERGLLTGKYLGKNVQLKPDDHRNGYFGQFKAEKIQALLAVLQPLATAKKATLSQLVLRFTTLQPGINIVLAGARNAQQAIENANAMQIDIGTAELQFIQNQLDKM